MTRGTNRAHVARAALEAIVFQSAEVLHAMGRDSGKALSELRVDGGATRNNLLLQFQADLLGVEVVRPQVTETTALGALWQSERRFVPAIADAQRENLTAGWQRAVERARDWAAC